MHHVLACAFAIGLAGAPLAAQSSPAQAPSLPAGYTLLSEHGDVRVFRYEGVPGSRNVMHTHPPHMAYIAHGGTLRFHYPNGQSVDAPLRTGQVLELSRPITHADEVIGTDTVVVIIVEYGEPKPRPDSARRDLPAGQSALHRRD